MPYSPQNNLLRNEVVLFPSEAAEYGSEQDLIDSIRDFLHRYLDISPLFERIASYYVLFTWVYDDFNELPYLRARGDMGSGKTRFLLTIGSLCYKPIFASGASTVSPLFRILDAVRGTLVIDEGDFRFSDEKAEMIKILNNGNTRGFPVLRSESVSGQEFSPKAYTVFGPKLVATRGFFDDRALESRCLTEEMGSRKLRKEIPININAAYKEEAQQLRNKLLLFRFRTVGKRSMDTVSMDDSVEPRLRQIFGPLVSVIEDPVVRESVAELAKQYHTELVADRGTDLEAQVLEIIQAIKQSADSAGLSVKEITKNFRERYGEEFERKITPHWMGHTIRKKLHLKTEKRDSNYFIAADQGAKLAHLLEKYGLGRIEASTDLPDSVREVSPETQTKEQNTSDIENSRSS